jgi:hypothetical protein
MSRYIKVWIYAATLIVVGCKTAPQPLPPSTDAAVDAAVAPDAALAVRTCPTGVGPKSPDAACDGRFTSDGHACAVCAVASGCLAVSTQVYCVKTCADTACRKR